jgi:hypothetical protein
MLVFTGAMICAIMGLFHIISKSVNNSVRNILIAEAVILVLSFIVSIIELNAPQFQHYHISVIIGSVSNCLIIIFCFALNDQNWFLQLKKYLLIVTPVLLLLSIINMTFLISPVTILIGYSCATIQCVLLAFIIINRGNNEAEHENSLYELSTL